MDFYLIERLIGLVEQSRVTEMDLTVAGIRVRIDRRVDQEPETAVVRSGEARSRTPSEAVAPQQPHADVLEERHHTIVAGLFGTFFRAPAPDQKPFVSGGDVVEEGQTLAILEAMKMLNPVEADRAGRILRILVENGVAVEAGTPLFTMVATE